MCASVSLRLSSSTQNGIEPFPWGTAQSAKPRGAGTPLNLSLSAARASASRSSPIYRPHCVGGFGRPCIASPQKWHGAHAFAYRLGLPYRHPAQTPGAALALACPVNQSGREALPTLARGNCCSSSRQPLQPHGGPVQWHQKCLLPTTKRPAALGLRAWLGQGRKSSG